MGKMKCAAPSCGAPNPSTRTTCYRCGGPLVEVKSSPPMKVILPVAIILVVIIAGAILKPIIARSRTPDDGSVKVSAAKLCSDYRENQLNADSRYEGMDVTVTGRVIRVVKNDVYEEAAKEEWERQLHSVFLEGHKNLQVRCDFFYEPALMELRAGQKVRIWGDCDGLDFSKQQRVIVIEGCKLRK